MAEQIQTQKKTSEKKTDTVQTQTPSGDTAKVQEKGEELKSDIDALLDEIDEVLEKNAAEFVAAYVQKGGE